jgi:hypothetical protein
VNIKRIIPRVLFVWLPFSIPAATFYLQSDMPVSSTPLDKTRWFDAPSGGTGMSVLGAPFTGNRFDVNGYVLRSPSSSTTTSTFSGTLVVNLAGAGLAELHTLGWNVAGMDVDNGFQLRLRQPEVSLSVSDLVLGSSGVLRFRTLAANNRMNLSVGNLSGSGALEFGDGTYANDTNAVWSLSMTGAAPLFTGAVSLVRGELSFSNAFELPDAELTVNSLEENEIVIAHDVTFRRIVYGATELNSGVYSASALNSALGTTRFSGPGKITAGKIPPALKLIVITN